MKLTTKWLAEWVLTGLSVEKMVDRLTMAGLEVASVAPVSPPINKLVVGEVMSVTAHPNADKLKVCEVNIGKSRPVRIVCGAANVAVGLKVPTALSGCTLPNGATIAAVEVRGVKSSGMLCSGAELGLEEESEGLLMLEPRLKAGSDAYAALALDDIAIDIELTPNRGDCLSVKGIARELAALTGKKLKQRKPNKARVQSRKTVPVKISARKECPRYIGRVVEGINPDAVTPLWMKERLRRAGVRAIHPVVDVTNFVMLELGQPMHGFDLSSISGPISVRLSRNGESLQLLDGQTVKLKAGSLLIADGKGPLALAGIMGGENSAVGSSTVDVFLESAYFAADAIVGRARQYGLQTDSSHRFERGVDPDLQLQAMEYATVLLLEIAGGKAGKLVKAESRQFLPKPPRIKLSAARVQNLLGIKIPPATIARYLARLGMVVNKRSADDWRVQPPGFRFDIRREVDLIEEIARMYGYGKIPALPMQSAAEMGAVPDGVASELQLKQRLAALGYQEVITYSFVAPGLQQLLVPGINTPRLSNPISEDMAEMRGNLLPGLVQTARYNLNRQQGRVRIFEMGNCFAMRGKQTVESARLGALALGPVWPEQWSGDRREVDFYDIKGDLQHLLALGGIQELVSYVPSKNPVLHPGKSADIVLRKRNIGFIGQINPEIQAKLDIDRPVYVFEIEKSSMQQQNIPEFTPISRFPAIRRDIAVVVDLDVTAQAVADCVKNHAGELLSDLELFDEYRGEGIDSGRKSLALGLILQDASRTLKEDAVESLMGDVMQALKKELGAEPRI